MRHLAALAALAALLAAGCNPTAEPPRGLYLDAGADVPPDDAGAPDAPDTGPPCQTNWLRCNGVCVFGGIENCGSCGHVCEGRTGCCGDGPNRGQCRFDCSQ